VWCELGPEGSGRIASGCRGLSYVLRLRLLAGMPCSVSPSGCRVQDVSQGTLAYPGS